jgi:hypothetical protein
MFLFDRGDKKSVVSGSKMKKLIAALIVVCIFVAGDAYALQVTEVLWSQYDATLKQLPIKVTQGGSSYVYKLSGGLLAAFLLDLAMPVALNDVDMQTLIKKAAGRQSETWTADNRLFTGGAGGANGAYVLAYYQYLWLYNEYLRTGTYPYPGACIPPTDWINWYYGPYFQYRSDAINWLKKLKQDNTGNNVTVNGGGAYYPLQSVWYQPNSSASWDQPGSYYANGMPYACNSSGCSYLAFTVQSQSNSGEASVEEFYVAEQYIAPQGAPSSTLPFPGPGNNYGSQLNGLFITIDITCNAQTCGPDLDGTRYIVQVFVFYAEDDRTAPDQVTITSLKGDIVGKMTTDQGGTDFNNLEAAVYQKYGDSFSNNQNPSASILPYGSTTGTAVQTAGNDVVNSLPSSVTQTISSQSTANQSGATVVNETGSQTQPTTQQQTNINVSGGPYSPQRAGSDYEPEFDDFKTLFENFINAMKNTSLFSLPGRLYNNIPNSGVCEMQVNCGQYFGTHTVSFCNWSGMLTGFKAVILVIFSYLAIRVIILKD